MMCKARNLVTVVAFVSLVGMTVATSPASAGDDDYALYQAQRAALEKQLAPEKAKCIATQDADACQNVSVIKEQMEELDQQNQGVIAAHEMDELQQEADKEAAQQMTTSIKRALAGDADAQQYVTTAAVQGDENAKSVTITLAKRWSSPSIDSAVQQLAQQGYAPAQQLLESRANAQLQQALNGDKQAEAAIAQRAQEGDATAVPVLIELAKRGDATAQIAVLHWAEESADHGAFGQPVMPDLGTAEVIQGLARDGAAWTVIRRYPDQAQALLIELKNLPAVSTSPAPAPQPPPQNAPRTMRQLPESQQVSNSQTPKPSFNCALAHSVVEGMICGSAELSALDSNLSGLYQTKLRSGPDPSVLRSEQRAWMRQRNACGASIACLEQAYQQRIAQLR